MKENYTDAERKLTPFISMMKLITPGNFNHPDKLISGLPLS
jgi:hypothetical protein